MTVNISKPSLNLREELAALRNQGGYSEQRFDFDGLVTNGTFDSDVSWTKGTGWTISSGVSTCDGSQAGNSDLSQILNPVDGKTYIVIFDVTRSAGTLYVRIGGTSSNGIVTTGTYSLTLVSGGGSLLEMRAISTFVGTIDNISVYETDGTNVIHTTPAGWLPKDVFVNGLLKREGSGWDYTVHTDGTKHWIKPTVAPSATTTTTILGVRA